MLINDKLWKYLKFILDMLFPITATSLCKFLLIIRDYYTVTEICCCYQVNLAIICINYY